MVIGAVAVVLAVPVVRGIALWISTIFGLSILLILAVAYAVDCSLAPRTTRLLPRLGAPSGQTDFTHELRVLALNSGAGTSRPLQIDAKEVQTAVEQIVALAVRDFVSSWYSPLAQDDSVIPNLVNEVVLGVVVEVARRLKHVDVSTLLVTRIVPFITTHINECRNAERLLKTNLKKYLDANERDRDLAAFYFGGKLHHAINDSDAYLRSLVEHVLPLVMPANDLSSPISRHISREIVLCHVLIPTLDMLIDPDFWNQNFNAVVRYRHVSS